MGELFDQIESLRQGEGRAALATLVSTHGTTPRKEGAKMWVGEDGRILGSVTIGGCVDAEVMAEAEDVLRGRGRSSSPSTSGTRTPGRSGSRAVARSRSSSSPIALGEGPAQDGALALYETMRGHVAAGGSGAILTRMDAPCRGQAAAP